MRPFQYTKAETAQAALQAQATQTSYLGGGTNLVDLMKEDVARPERLIDVSSLQYDQVSSNENGGLSLGAMMSNAETANHVDIRKKISSFIHGHAVCGHASNSQYGDQRRQPASAYKMSLFF